MNFFPFFLNKNIQIYFQPNVERNAADEMQASEAAGSFHYSTPLPLDDEEEEESEEGFADATENFSKLTLNPAPTPVAAAPAPPPAVVLVPTPAPPPPIQVQRPIVDPDPIDDDFGDDGGDLDLNDPEVRKLMEEDFDDEDDLLN